MFVVYFLTKEKKYILDNEFFYVQDKGIIKIVSNSSEKLIFRSQNKTILGKKTLYPINKEKVIFELVDGIYLYNTKSKKTKKILDEGFSLYDINSSYDSVLVLNNNILYLLDINSFNLRKLKDDVKTFSYPYNMYNNPLFINSNKVLYKNSLNQLEVLNLTNNSITILENSLFNSCYPYIKIKSEMYICKKDKKFHILNKENGTIKKLNNLDSYSNYLQYIESINAIMYTKLSFSFFNENFNTRIYFLNTQKDYLWSKKYIQPSIINK